MAYLVPYGDEKVCEVLLVFNSCNICNLPSYLAAHCHPVDEALPTPERSQDARQLPMI